jgi:ElaB/YqjD/DUF883 family membrane-anchored ribosome-binding protein
MKPTRTSVSERVSHAAGEALAATTHALDSSRLSAFEAAGKVGEAVSDATAAAQRGLAKYAGTARSYVADEPMKSALIAAAIGAAAAALALAIFGRRRDSD